jgi:PilZ domain
MGNVRCVPERRMTPRADVALPCVLRRRSGSAIDARTVDLGAGGMRIATRRPLATDELLDFDLRLGADGVDGRARVLRQEGHDAYALRFEGLLEPARERLAALASARPLD